MTAIATSRTPRERASRATRIGRVVLGDEMARGTTERDVGGKARSLGALIADGARVPALFCVSTAVFAEVLARIEPQVAAALAGIDYRDRRSIKDAADAIAARFAAAGLRAADVDLVAAAFDRSFDAGAHVAVRSSAVGEDSAHDSFAGQLETYLWVQRRDVVERIVRCFASAFGERALLYRHLRGLPALEGVRAAVIVQRMVDSRAAGVLFTANPTTGDTNEIVVSAGLGLGEGVVNGSVECDAYHVNATTLEVHHRTIADKRSRVAFDRAAGTGTAIVAVEPGQAGAPVLDDAALHALASAGRALARQRNAPQDLEWAIDGAGQLFLLQARPITALRAGRQTIFDNSNVVESYPGLSSPLTFSFVRLGYEVLFRESSRLFGVTRRALEANHDIYPNLLGLLDGRIYYNISSWYRMFLQLPGMEQAIPAWEKALGIERRFAAPARRAGLWALLISIPVRLALVVRLVRRWIGLPRMVERFRAASRAIEDDVARHPLDALEAGALVDLAETYARDLRPRYAVTVVNDFVTQQLYDVVKRLIGRWRLGDPDATRNQLLCGERGMDSVEPVRSLVRLAEAARQQPAVRALLEGPLPAEAVWARIDELSESGGGDPAGSAGGAGDKVPRGIDGDPAFGAAARQHIERYGDRTLEELKLETPTLRERPHGLVAMLRNYLRGGQSVDAMERREQAIRRAAEASVRARLRFRPLRRLVFWFVLATCRWGIKTRENLRLARSRSFGVIKRIYRAIGQRYAERRILADADDVFFLGIDEIAGYARGSSLTRDVAALVAQRKAEYAAYHAKALAPRIVTHGVVYAHRFERAVGHHDDARTVRGIACSPGRVTAPVKVVLAPSAELRIDGEILVAAATDPGWVFLMVAAGGLISEKGSVLSHTAIIGRELGIPTVVGIADATTRFVDGEVVELDGDAGQVARQS